ncbi:FAD/NAD-P-binding domain-containing protein [Dendrothele bispora CBS 962.96]|uniref:FAD/NAD-P-binding domain-containing protein n=1 Tax=Dendrothele bispora (strain CBS 962.96) TaxID=1314807 RepID=A0A4S8MTE7_DENBC|nr:FAD/NAD-P-binding domain-containing protein [Dendrothele bispora CBS 962.96]
MASPLENGFAASGTQFKLGEFASDEPRRMRVVIIGAGYSGITAGIRFLQRVRNLEMTIYDAYAGIGGTWYINKYPGLACDIPAHSYQLTFADNPNWSSFYAPGPEIREYLESVVEKYKLMPYIKLQHKLTRAEYNEETGKWHLTIQRPSPVDDDSAVEEFTDIADVLFTGIGALNRWDWPDIDGLETFQGKVIHSAQWKTGEGDDDPKAKWEDTVTQWKDKKVAVIGVGSSAIQIVPSIQPKVTQLANFVRGKTWISATFGKGLLAEIAKDDTATNYKYTEEDKKKFQDPLYYNKYRREIERDSNAAYAATIVGSHMQEMGRKLFREDMIKRLAKRPWIADHLLPDFAVACRRLTPGPGYLEALCEDNVEFVPDVIKRVTANGIETVDGKHRDFDIIICATGFNISYKLPFTFVGRGGVKLTDKFDPHPRTYLGVAVDGFPNWFACLGPNSGVGAGSLLIIMERQVDYAVQATLKLQRERLKSIEVKKEAIDDFDEYLDNYFPKSVFGSKCRSWYKMGKEEGRVVALWPGSPLHAVHALSNPRWEDYKYELLDPGVKNRFYWLGDGSTMADNGVPGTDSSWYLDPTVVDFPPVPT